MKLLSVQPNGTPRSQKGRHFNPYRFQGRSRFESVKMNKPVRLLGSQLIFLRLKIMEIDKNSRVFLECICDGRVFFPSSTPGILRILTIVTKPLKLV